jgi:hypothetical protein
VSVQFAEQIASLGRPDGGCGRLFDKSISDAAVQSGYIFYIVGRKFHCAASWRGRSAFALTQPLKRRSGAFLVLKSPRGRLAALVN